MPFGKKLIFSLIGFQVLFIGLLSILGFYFVYSTINDQFSKRIDSFSLQLETSLKTAMISYDLGTLGSIGEQAIKLPDLVTLKIYLSDTLVVNQTNANLIHSKQDFYSKDILASNQKIGKVVFSISREQLESNKKRIYTFLILLCSIEFIFSVIVAIMIGKHITRRTQFLINGINKYAEGDLNFQYEVKTNDEFGIVAKSFNEMTQKMSELRVQNVQNSKMAALGEMAGSIAHEINNPLTVIKSLSKKTQEELSQQDQNKEKVISNLDKINSMSTRIAKIVSGLRTFSRNAESDPLEPVTFNKLLEDSLSLCSSKFDFSSVKLIIENSISKETQILCRETQISQVIINLLNNAFDAVEHSSHSWVKLESYLNKNFFIIKVVDSGKGIKQEDLDKIMEPFFTTKQVGKGTGLGLSISKGIIEGHSGKFYYDKNNANTCFVIEFPRAKILVSNV